MKTKAIKGITIHAHKEAGSYRAGGKGRLKKENNGAREYWTHKRKSID